MVDQWLNNGFLQNRRLVFSIITVNLNHQWLFSALSHGRWDVIMVKCEAELQWDCTEKSQHSAD